MTQFIAQHYEEVLQILGAVVALATLIVKLTPMQKDDSVLAKIINVLSALSLCNADGSFIGKRAE
ncbi:MAG: hypothetical protein J5601_00855 [Elusimicrobiaceae bacterium]|nr:hypothetical protein [Elusimicrobiaceae bacterium]